MRRREFLAGAAGAAVACMAPGVAWAVPGADEAARRPNVVLIITDDQGYGDLGCHGNPDLRTPRLDRLRSEGVWFDRFYTMPVCSPTRACLMTGRYHFRTGVVDTYLGRSMMHGDEVTLAECLAAAGYATGLFGKWHLGDHYPMRPMDQGFQEVLMHPGGGIGQPSDPPDNRYLDPILQHNGESKRFAGYCTDIFTEAALAFIGDHRDRPFFAYLATNAPHTPLEVEEEYAAPYRERGFSDRVARVYGMIANLDRNVGRVLDRLAELDLEGDTIVLFMTDNGPQMQEGERYNAGLRSTKGTVYEGGVRVPCFVRWPRRWAGGRGIDTVAAHIDLMPTLLEACGAAPPPDRPFDGRSLMPLLDGGPVEWPERTVYVQWHRGTEPEPHRNAACIGPRYKLVEGRELYDIEADPGETRDLAADRPEVVARMRAGYDAWFSDVCSTRGFDAPPRIVLGGPETLVVLTRQDWRGAEGHNDEHVGHWDVKVARDGPYGVTLKFGPPTAPATAHFRCGPATAECPVSPGAGECRMEASLVRGEGRVEAWLQTADGRAGMRYVEMEGP